MVWMSLDCEAAEAVQSSGRSELDELGPGTGDKGVQKCVIAWLRWRLLEANACYSDCVCDTSAFTPSVPKLRDLWQSVHCASNSLWRMDFNQVNSGCLSQHCEFTLSHSCSRFCSRRHSGIGEVYDNKFQPGCWQNATCVPGYFRKKFKTRNWLWISTTHFPQTQNKIKKKRVTMEAVNEHTYLRPN